MSVGAAEVLPAPGGAPELLLIPDIAPLAVPALLDAPAARSRGNGLARVHRVPDRDRDRGAARRRPARASESVQAEPEPHRFLRFAARADRRASLRGRSARR